MVARHSAPVITIRGSDRPTRRGLTRGAEFPADSPTALVVLAPVVGPTAVLLLRLLGQSVRTGVSEWHIADLAGMLGVTPSRIHHAIERLEMFGWLTHTDEGSIVVHLVGSLSPKSLHELHPLVAAHYQTVG
jgi:hypothetical protein